jgi:hypothetical protein
MDAVEGYEYGSGGRYASWRRRLGGCGSRSRGRGRRAGTTSSTLIKSISLTPAERFVVLVFRYVKYSYEWSEKEEVWRIAQRLATRERPLNRLIPPY